MLLRHIYHTDQGSCPVQLFKLYLEKLNKSSNALWQKPKQGTVFYIEEEWYQNRAVGRDMCERFMKLSLAKSVKLDGEYTNHSIRATVISTLDNAGFEARHIIQLSSHKSESTIKEYSTKCPENKRKEMFNSLTEAMTPKSKTPKLSKAKEPAEMSVIDVKQNLPNFELQEIDDFETIDDTLLAQILDDHDKQNTKNSENSNNNNNQVAAGSSNTHQIQQNSQFNTQVFNQNVPASFRFPGMYFPNSNVTINYNFGK